MRVPILSERDIEERAAEILADYSRKTGRTITFPIPIERMIDVTFDIPILWEHIPTRGTQLIVSKITQPMFNLPSRIVLNEDLRDTVFRKYPGLEQTALAHEAGHSLFHIDHSLVKQLGFESMYCHEFLTEASMLTNPLDEIRSQLGPIGDDWWREWQAHTFMRYLLMPQALLQPFVEEGQHLTWPGLYALRDRLQVTISALVVHLQKLEIIRIDDGRRIHDLTSQTRGQLSFD